MSKEDKKGYTVLDTVDVHNNRPLPNSDTNGSKEDNFTYQDNPWDKSDPQDGKK